ncbi:hypothetical protein KTO58_18945 [Chitinophaga pendula]|uniref:DUF6443 domain-containing protein n=1 Tax=Chitinophaga TaxID=79328 RepID=UPI000BBF7CE7|nr:MULTISPECIES: DUF6443 domain-containing protein [Chitinophaga]ASZ11250.1 hypothetical protein CK934_09870 [Chitinophaga sp. MD30]UCJ05752.1 hypothetical protein KTO58_18945 [Chitinophaga pendula]
MRNIILLLILLFNCHIAGAQYKPAPYGSDVKVNYMRSWEPVMPVKDTGFLISTARTIDEVKQTFEYIDGMGRVIQTVDKGLSPVVNGSGKLDMVKPVVFDAVGQQSYKFAPYVANTSSGNFRFDPFGEQRTFLQTQYPGENFFYEQTIYEKSTLKRTIKSLPVGNSWAGSDRGTVQQHLYNTSADAVRIWTIENAAGSIPKSTVIYPAGTLSKLVMINENGKRTVEFKSMKGKTILKKEELTTTVDGHNGWLCTYFIYDVFDQLRFVIPPKAVAAISGDWSLTSKPELVDELCYSYAYDDRNRMILKKIPGSTVEEMVYDSRDRLAFKRDGNLKSANRWFVNFYDNYNRTIMTGFYKSAVSREALQQSLNTATGTIIINNIIADKGYYDLVVPLKQPGITVYKARNSIDFIDGFDSGAEEMEGVITNEGSNSNISLSVNNPLPGISEADIMPLSYAYYDDYSWPGVKAYEGGYAAKLIAGNNPYPVAVTKSDRVIGKLTGTKTRVLIPGGGEQWLSRTAYFDENNREIQNLSDNITGGVDILTTRYNFIGAVISTYMHHRNPQSRNTLEMKVLTVKEYDHGGRLMTVKRQLNDAGSLKDVVKYTYNPVGQMAAKVFGDNLQRMTFDYNIRGWKTGMNKSYLNNDDQDYRFGYELAYDKVESVISGANYSNASYNANIAGMTWRGVGDGLPRKYDFLYDARDRLMKADFQEKRGANWNNTVIDYTVRMGDGANPGSAYDANGNVLRMLQKGLKGTQPDVIDNLEYKYISDFSNRLKYVVDEANDERSVLGDFKEPAANNTANKTQGISDYSYDINGNITADKNKGITNIIYNHLDLPEKITFEGKGSIEFFYDEKGEKYRKKVIDLTTSPTKTTITDYDGGFVYQNDSLQYFDHMEGRTRMVYKAGQQPTPVYDYYVEDHLGNTRILLTEQTDFTMYSATMEAGSAEKELALFSNIDNTRSAKPNGYPEDNTTDKNEQVAKLNAKAGGQKIGPSIVLKVMAGDTVQIGAKAFYKSIGPSDNKQPAPVEDMVMGLVQAFSGNGSAKDIHGGSSAGPANPFTNEFYNNNYQRLKEKDPNRSTQERPRAYLNYVLFDEQFNLVEENSGVRQVKATPDELQSLVQDKMKIRKNGFLYVYTSNESQQDVYFDNIMLGINAGPVLEETHYYPLGLTMAGISYNALKDSRYAANRIKYNKKELQQKELTDGSGLDWYDFGARMYDVQTGRWNHIDPKAMDAPNWSPYNSMWNNPIKYVDPDGAWAGPPSTHTDMKGNVIAVRNDGHLGIYRHSAADIQSGRINNDLQKMIGFTLYEKSFMVGDRINFKSYRAKEWLNAFEANQQAMLGVQPIPLIRKATYAMYARNGQVFDPKSYMEGGVNGGSQISEGVYISNRDLGNYAAGAFARINGLHKESYLLETGAFNLSRNNLKSFLANHAKYIDEAQRFDPQDKIFQKTYGEDERSNYFIRLGYENIHTLNEFNRNFKTIFYTDNRYYGQK